MASQRDPLDHATLAFGLGFAVLIGVRVESVAVGSTVLGLNLLLSLCALRCFPWMRAGDGLRRFFGIALPLLVFYCFYRECALVLGRSDIVWLDAVVARPELGWWAELGDRRLPLLGEVLALGYMAYVPLLLVVVVVLLATPQRGARAPAETFVRRVCIAWAICYIVFLVVPVLGPRLRFVSMQDPRMGTGPFSALAQLNQDHGMIRGAAFPSAHVAATAVALWSVWRQRRGVFWAALPVGILLVVGAVYLGYHYIVDVLAGLVVAAMAAGADWAVSTTGSGRIASVTTGG